MSIASRFVRIIRTKSSLTFARILGTVASAVIIAMLASQLRSLFGSLAVVAVTSALSLTIAEVIRVTLVITGEKARTVLPIPEIDDPREVESGSAQDVPPEEPEKVSLRHRWYVRYGSLLLVTGLLTTVVNWWFDQDDPAPVTVIQNPTERVELPESERQALLDEAESNLETVKEEVQTLNDEVAELDDGVTDEDLAALTERLSVAEQALADAQSKVDALTAMFNELDSRIDDLDARLGEVETTPEPTPTPTPDPASEQDNDAIPAPRSGDQ